MVEQWNISWRNSKTSYPGTLEHLMVEQWNRDGGTVKHLIVEQSNIKWWNSRTEIVEQWNCDCGTVEHLKVEQRNGGTIEHLMVEKYSI